MLIKLNMGTTGFPVLETLLSYNQIIIIHVWILVYSGLSDVYDLIYIYVYNARLTDCITGKFIIIIQKEVHILLVFPYWRYYSGIIIS